MTEKEVVIDAYHFWSDPLMWSCIAMVLIGTISRALISSEPLSVRKLAGEALLTAIGAVGIYAAGMLRGADPMEQVLYSSLMSLGGIRVVQHVLQLLTKGVKP